MVENTALNPKVNNFSFYNFPKQKISTILLQNVIFITKTAIFYITNYSNKSSKNCINHKNFNSVVALVIERIFNSTYFCFAHISQNCISDYFVFTVNNKRVLFHYLRRYFKTTIINSDRFLVCPKCSNIILQIQSVYKRT
jgi:hypothetical protein